MWMLALGPAGSPSSPFFFDSTVGIDVAGVDFLHRRWCLVIIIMGFSLSQGAFKKPMENIWWRIRLF